MTISVIMAAYNHGKYIRTALESILQQPYSQMEIVVVDDGSTDATEAVVRGLIQKSVIPIHYLKQANQGQAAAFNVALRQVRGEVIAFLDADDLWPPSRLPSQLSLFNQSEPSGTSKIGIVLGRKEYFSDAIHVNPIELANANQRAVHYCLAASLIARWVFDSVGEFDGSVGFCADWDWFARAREMGIPTQPDPRVTVLGRIHGSNITQNRTRGNHFAALMLKKHKDRLANRQKEDA